MKAAGASASLTKDVALTVEKLSGANGILLKPLGVDDPLSGLSPVGKAARCAGMSNPRVTEVDDKELIRSRLERIAAEEKPSDTHEICYEQDAWPAGNLAEEVYTMCATPMSPHPGSIDWA